MERASTEVPLSIPIWTEQLRIRSYDVDATRRATSVSLCRYFLEAAWNHAEALGFGFSHLHSQGKFWVLARLRFDIQHFPAWGDRTTLSTWPRGISSAFALRDFEFVDEAGSPLAAGSSAWLVLDSGSKRPQRLHKLLPSLATINGKAALGQDPEKLEENETWDNDSPIAVRYTDIDVNQHVNSTRYIAWMLDTYPVGFHLNHGLRVLEVNYLSETREGDQLIVRNRQSDPRLFRHSLIKADGTEVCRARLEWTTEST